MFLSDVYDLYLRVMLNQLQLSTDKVINGTVFDSKVRQLAKKYF